MKVLLPLATAALLALPGLAAASPIAPMTSLSHRCPAVSNGLVDQPLAGQDPTCLLSAVPWIDDSAGEWDGTRGEGAPDVPSHRDASPEGMIHLVPRLRG